MRLVRLILMAAFGIAGFAVATLGLNFPLFAGLLLLGSAWRKSRGRWRGGWAHGTARVANLWDCIHGNLMADRGIYLGRADFVEAPPRGMALRGLFSPWLRSSHAVTLFLASFLGRRGGIIRVGNPVHIAVFASTGSGKSAFILVNVLKDYRGPCVIVDPKGELYNLTSGHRRRWGRRVLKLDPFQITGPGSESLNSLSFLSDGDDLIDQARDLASLLVLRSGREIDPHWCDQSESVIAGFIAYIIACEQNLNFVNLQTLRQIVASRDTYSQAMKAMQGTDGMLRLMGEQLSWLIDRELGSVMSHVQRFTNFLDSPAIASTTLHSSFDPRELRDGKTDLFLILPPERMNSPLMRLYVGTLLSVLTRGGADDRVPVTFFLDEAAQLGKTPILEKATTVMRGYGIRLVYFFQSMGQMHACYGDNAQTMMDNISTKLFFGTNSFESADAVSKQIGDCTIVTRSLNRTRSTSQQLSGGPFNRQQSGNSTSTSTSLTESEAGRRLFKPEEILSMPPSVGILIHRNMPIVLIRLVPHFSGQSGAGEDTGGQLVRSYAAATALLFFSLVFAAAILLVPFVPVPTQPPARRVPGSGGYSSSTRRVPYRSNGGRFPRQPQPVPANRRQPQPQRTRSIFDGTWPSRPVR